MFSGNTPFKVALLVIVFFRVAVAEPTKSNALSLTNGTDRILRIDASNLVGVDGKKQSWAWLLLPGEAIKEIEGKPINVTEFTFSVATSEGQTGPWRLSSDKNNLTCVLDEAYLSHHKRLLQEQRNSEAPGASILTVLVEPFAEVTADGSKVPLRYGYALVVLTQEKAAISKPPGMCIVSIQQFRDGKPLIERKHFRYVANTACEWDCRDLVSPSIILRTAKYILEVREQTEFAIHSTKVKATVDNRATTLEQLAAYMDNYPPRGIDDDVIAFNSEQVKQMRLLAKYVKSGTAREVDLDDRLDDIRTKLNTLEKHLSAKYGDSFDVSILKGGRQVTGNNPIAISAPGPPVASNDNESKRVDIKRAIIDLQLQLVSADRQDEADREWNREQIRKKLADAEELKREVARLRSEGKTVQAGLLAATVRYGEDIYKTGEFANKRSANRGDRIRTEIAELERKLLDIRD